MEYRIYFTHPLDRGMGYIPVLEKDDGAAIATAKEIAVKRPFDLWMGYRLVFRKRLENPCDKVTNRNNRRQAPPRKSRR